MKHLALPESILWSTICAFVIALGAISPNWSYAAKPLLQIKAGGLSASNRSIVFTSDESQFLTAGDDKVVRVWDRASHQLLREVRGEASDHVNGGITAMALSSDSQWLAVGVFYPHQHNGQERRGVIRIHDFASGQIVRLLEGNHQAVRTLSFSSDNRLLLASEASNRQPKILIWETASWQLKKSLDGHKDQIFGAAFSRDNSKIVSASWDGSIRVWNTDSGKQIRKIVSAHKGRIYNLLVPKHSTEPVAVTGATDKTVKIWNYETGKLQKTIKVKRKVRQITVDQAGHYILASSVGFHKTAWVDIIDANKGKIISTFRGHDRTVMAMHVLSDRDTVYSTGGYRNELLEWSLSSGNINRTLISAGRPVEAVAFSKDGKTLFWGNQEIDWSGKKFNPARRAAVSMKIDLTTIHGQLGEPQALHTKPKGVMRASHKTGAISLQRVKDKKTGFNSKLKIKNGSKTLGIITRDTRSGYFHSAYTLTPDSNHVISGGESGYLSLFDRTGNKKGDFNGHHDLITDLAISPDGKLLVSGSRDQTMKLWDIASQKLLLSFFISKDGEWIVWAPTGHYTSSPNGDQYIGWAINRGFDRNAEYVSASQMRAKLYRPDVIERILNNKSIQQAIQQSPQIAYTVEAIQEAKVIPVDFEVLSPSNGSVTDQEAVNLEVNVIKNADSDIAWSVTVNGRQIMNKNATRGLARTKPKGDRFTFPILLEYGENRIHVVADNRQTEKEATILITRAQSPPTSQTITKSASPTLPPKPVRKLLVLAVGVDEYIHMPEHNLRFASADADSIASLFIKQEGKNYDVVESIVLSDSVDTKATKDNVVDALDALAELGPEDTVVLFLAGHGVVEDANYYFLPRDAQRNSNGRWKKSSVIAWNDVQLAMESSLGRRILLVDTCHSESAFNSRLIKDAEDSNIVVMSSTDSGTLAQEIASLGHGVFTHALLEGMRGKADSYQDGKVTMSELNAFVANAVPAITKNAQKPTLSVPGGFQDFVLASL
ncbi:MAG: caspase family protein [Acidiferrobacterales bacterium]|nr:caspase family protein [Acidiferrobacterales bacterium]